MEKSNIEVRVYTPEEVCKMLAISRTSCYDLLTRAEKTSDPFRVVRINKSIRVPREGLEKWLTQG